MARRRVLIFSLAYHPFIGGAEVAVQEITARLANDFEFEITSADVRSFWSKYLYPFWASRQAVRKHRAKNYDLVWAIMANQAGMAAALFKRKFPKIPFLLTLQEGDDLNSLAYRARLLAPRLFGVFKLADRAQAISHYLAGWAKRMGARCPISVIPNGVDLSRFQVIGYRDQLKKEQTIITTSRLVKKNGVDILIESLKFLPDNVKLTIVGSGPEEKNLKLKTITYNLEARVNFLGYREARELPALLARADIFARPSRSEGLGNSFLEAMAVNLPVIGTPVGGIPDFLINGQTGWFCEVDNPKSLAEKVKFILDPVNSAAVAQVVARARQMVLDEYNWDIIAQKMAQLFNS